MIELKHQDTENEIHQLKEQNKILQHSVITLECRAMGSYIRLRGIPEAQDENIFEVVLDKIPKYLKEKPDDISYNFEAI